ncbi:MAG: hypothetical protein DI590_18415 [Methylorubrum populi]|nr:MAG: hypothetical protein DI590_18415 [Methylorubrum populi]
MAKLQVFSTERRLWHASFAARALAHPSPHSEAAYQGAASPLRAS